MPGGSDVELRRNSAAIDELNNGCAVTHAHTRVSAMHLM